MWRENSIIAICTTKEPSPYRLLRGGLRDIVAGLEYGFASWSRRYLPKQSAAGRRHADGFVVGGESAVYESRLRCTHGHTHALSILSIHVFTELKWIIEEEIRVAPIETIAVWLSSGTRGKIFVLDEGCLNWVVLDYYLSMQNQAFL